MLRMWSKVEVDGWKYSTKLCGFAVRTELFGKPKGFTDLTCSVFIREASIELCLGSDKKD